MTTTEDTIASIQDAVGDERMAAFRQRRDFRMEDALEAFPAEAVAEYHRREEEKSARWRREKADFERRQAEFALQAALRNSLLPRRFHQCRFNQLNLKMNPKAHQVCAAYADELCYGGKPGLLLKGPPGTGKTTLAAACLLHRLDAGRTGIFVNLPRLLQEVRDRYDDTDNRPLAYAARTGPQFSSLLQVADFGFCIIDDVGRSRLTDWGGEQFYALIDALYANERHVIFTSNAGQETLAANLDEAVMSRIAEMTYPIVMAGKDLRVG